jgi:hypothetical protein
MILDIGHFAAITALVLGLVGMAAPWVGLATKNGVWVAVGR